MGKKVSEAEVKSLVSSMEIEGFSVSEDRVRSILQGYYDNGEPAHLEKLLNELEADGADPVALMRAHALLMARRKSSS